MLLHADPACSHPPWAKMKTRLAIRSFAMSIARIRSQVGAITIGVVILPTESFAIGELLTWSGTQGTILHVDWELLLPAHTRLRMWSWRRRSAASLLALVSFAAALSTSLGLLATLRIRSLRCLDLLC